MIEQRHDEQRNEEAIGRDASKKYEAKQIEKETRTVEIKMNRKIQQEIKKGRYKEI